MVWINVLIFIASSFLLVRSGVWVVRSLVRIAQFLKWRRFIVSSVLMAFSTSLPETFVSITSSLQGKPQLSFGVVMGSNIVVLTLVVGIATFLSKKGSLKFESATLQRASSYAGIYGLLPILLMSDGYVSRGDGIILMLALVFYFGQLLSGEEKFTKVLSGHFQRDWMHFKLFLKNLGIFFLGIACLLVSAEGIVYSSAQLAAYFNFSLIIMGAVLVALGTSLPELTFGIRSITMGHESMILGDVMGSVVVNSAWVLGLAALISPFDVSQFFVYFKGYIFTVATCLFFVIFSATDRKITKKEAAFLIFVYIVFLVVETI